MNKGSRREERRWKVKMSERKEGRIGEERRRKKKKKKM